jgi:hypothetical protein
VSYKVSYKVSPRTIKVKKGIFEYTCRVEKLKDGRIVIRCGACRRGDVTLTRTCRVCHAERQEQP